MNADKMHFKEPVQLQDKFFPKYKTTAPAGYDQQNGFERGHEQLKIKDSWQGLFSGFKQTRIAPAI